MPDAHRRGSLGELRRVGEACLWALVIGVAVVAALRVAAELRLVVLPVLLALVLGTMLAPPARWLKERGWPDGLAALSVLVAAVAVLATAVALVVPPAIDDFAQLDVGIAGGLEEVQRWLSEGPLGLSDADVDDALDRAQEEFRANAEALTQGAVTGALVLAEVLTGLVLAVVLLFFFLKDGAAMWAWLAGLAPSGSRDAVREAGERAWDALGGFLRGQTIVALFDAVLIALALVLIGVPLVLPLALLTFFGAYVPVLGATIAGSAAALVALFAEGPISALLVVGAILAVQQIEGNALQPYVVGRSVSVHPVAILLGITVGAVLAGIIGAMVAAPAVAIAGAILRFVRERSEQDAGVVETSGR